MTDDELVAFLRAQWVEERRVAQENALRALAAVYTKPVPPAEAYAGEPPPGAVRRSV
ncbi:hypothetical protein [Streptomyces sp. NBC_01508]|uniref:hypothetical protein n=1 Tax=Streptomyces sp. NBC_01508 TaxID=2903888 RepID=UPI0038705693